MKRTADLIGRLFLGFIFLYEAYDATFYYKANKEKMSAYGLIWNQDWLLISAIVFLILGGTLLVIGYRTQLGSFLLLLYWLPITFIVHAFWREPFDCQAVFPCYERIEDLRRLEATFFMKNIAIAGGLLMVFANGTGSYSIRRIFATAKVPRTKK